MTDDLRSTPQEILPPEDDLPHVIASSDMSLFGVKLRCHVLSNGMRVIDADDMHEFMRVLESGSSPEFDPTDDDYAKIAAFLCGGVQ